MQMGFFTQDTIKNGLVHYLSKKDVLSDEHLKLRSDLNRELLSEINVVIYFEHLVNITLSSMNNEPKEWDRCTTFNINNVGQQFIGYLGQVDKTIENDSTFYLLVVRFFLEFYITSDMAVEHEFHDVATFLLINRDLKIFEELREEDKRQLSWTLNAMPVAINRGLANLAINNIIPSFENTHEEIKQIHKTVKEYDEIWEQKLIERQVKVDALEAKLKGYQQEFNFVALHDAFKSLGTNKTIDLKQASMSVRFWKWFSLLLPIASFAFYWSLKDPFVFLPTSSILIMTLLFYRVALVNKNSIKSQLIQIDLRKALCQFIESYSDFSAELKVKNEYTLKRFEDLIFSGIVTKDDKLPATFDGVDQLGKIFKEFKK